MTIEVIYRVLKSNGELAGEYMDRKLAEAHDQKLDCIYAIVDLIADHAKGLDTKVIEGIAEHLVNNRQAVMSALKKVKDVAPEEPQASQ
ncbi:MAG: YebG family protein, partial [Gammaproteobacteria bacterium]|nr:YebG family protein [Gammaproteobacteria bacterium]